MLRAVLPGWYRPSGVVGTVVVSEGQVLATVEIRRLVELLDPLEADPWGVGRIAVRQVDAALRQGRLRAENPYWCDGPEGAGTAKAHAERIAWLIRYGWDVEGDPLRVEVDVHGRIGLNDGNHRLFALAVLRIAGPVTVDVSGYLDPAEDLLEVSIP